MLYLTLPAVHPEVAVVLDVVDPSYPCITALTALFLLVATSILPWLLLCPSPVPPSALLLQSISASTQQHFHVMSPLALLHSMTLMSLFHSAELFASLAPVTPPRRQLSPLSSSSSPFCAVATLTSQSTLAVALLNWLTPPHALLLPKVPLLVTPTLFASVAGGVHPRSRIASFVSYSS